MRDSLTIVYSTARAEPCFDWFFKSLEIQRGGGIPVIVVDGRLGHNETLDEMRGKELRAAAGPRLGAVSHVPVKPNPWQGRHRLTREDWWAAAAARNTGLCLCRTPWVAFLDDRCVLAPGWLDRAAAALTRPGVTAGSYRKHWHLRVEYGRVVDEGQVMGRDHRAAPEMIRRFGDPVGGAYRTPYCGHTFGCCLVSRVEDILAVNGFDESCDGLGGEDSILGVNLEASGIPIWFDPALLMIEDRTPEYSGPTMKKTDKGVSPNDKSHAMVARSRGRPRATHAVDLRAVREMVLRGDKFPPYAGPDCDWYDGQPMREM